MVVVKGRCAVSKLYTTAPGPDSEPPSPASTTSSPPAGSRPRKSLGQHFLTDGRVLSRIVAAADLSPEDWVLEIGPGNGALTRRLIQNAGRVIAVEMDAALAAALPSRLQNPPNLTTVNDDARTVGLPPLLGDTPGYKVVANLPYYAANPIIRRFLESELKPELMVVMVQQEVARSMLARPGQMSILSVATQFYAVPKLVCNVPARAFRPPPNVTSSVIRLDLRTAPALNVDDRDSFFSLVRAGFTAPRKQLRNSLSQGLRVQPGEVGVLLEVMGLDGRRRPETLSIEEWGAVYQQWQARSTLGNIRSG